MPRVAKKLSAIELTWLGPGSHAVGGVAGLLLQVSEGRSLGSVDDGKTAVLEDVPR